MSSRLADSIETVLNLSDGLLIVDVIGGEPHDSAAPSLCLPGLRDQYGGD